MPSIFDLFNDDFFKNMMEYDHDVFSNYGNERCPGCGMTFHDFNRMGKFGCSQCYDAFREQVDPLIKRIQGSLSYEGSVPNRGSSAFSTVQQIKRLKQKLDKAVKAENYEEATLLRDQILALEKSVEK